MHDIRDEIAAENRIMTDKKDHLENAARIADQIADEHDETAKQCKEGGGAFNMARERALGARDVAHRLRADAAKL